MSTLSVCLIVKDEEKNLPRALKSVEGLTDEIIVVDTGSTDSTIEIAKHAGARTFSHEWRHDFSEARNFALDQATSEWVLQLDADEALHESSRRIRELLTVDQIDAFYFQVLNLTNPDDFQGAVGHQFVRLFRREGWRYEGVIHECPVFREARRPKMASSGLEIVHWGYADKEAAPIRAKRNEDLLARAIKKDPDDFLLHYYIGDVFYAESKWAEALSAFRRADDLRPEGSDRHHSLFVLKICESLRRGGQLKEARERIDLAAQQFPDYRDLLFLAGVIHEDSDDLSTAIAYYERCARIKTTSPNYLLAREGLDAVANRKAQACRRILADRP